MAGLGGSAPVAGQCVQLNHLLRMGGCTRSTLAKLTSWPPRIHGYQSKIVLSQKNSLQRSFRSCASHFKVDLKPWTSNTCLFTNKTVEPFVGSVQNCCPRFTSGTEHLNGRKHFHTAVHSLEAKNNQDPSIPSPDQWKTDGSWSLRLSAENGYLSWMRNSYLITAVGLAMVVDTHNSMAQHAGLTSFMVALFNMMVGTIGYIHNVSGLRKSGRITVRTGLLYQTIAILHLLLWCSILLVYGAEYIIEIEEAIEESAEDTV